MTSVRRFLYKPAGFATIASLVTLFVIGGVVVAATPLGCQTGHKLGLRSTCATKTAVVITTPSASATASPSPQFPSPSPTFYAPPPATASPAFPSPSPFPSPTHNPSLLPYQYDASAAIPPTYPSSSVPQPVDVAFSCRLPVFAGGSGSGGFIVFPGGQFVADPKSAVTPPSPPAGYSPPPQYGPGPGNYYNLSYDRAVGRWLPVSRSAVAPDGKHYALTFYGSEGIYVVDVTTGAQAEIGDGKLWNVLDVEAEGVYAVNLPAANQPGAGLWLLPFSGTPTQIIATGYWTAIGGGAAYGTETSAVPQGATVILLRLDLKTAQSEPWFSVAGGSSNVTGFDGSGAPVIADNYQITQYGNTFYGSEIWVVPALGKGYPIEGNPNFNGPVLGDSHGIWMSGGNSTWLYVPGQGKVLVANIGGQLAGECA